MPDRLQKIAAAATKAKQMTAQRIAAQHLLNLQQYDGGIRLTNNAAARALEHVVNHLVTEAERDRWDRALRGFALGRKSWLFAGSELGADRAAAMATLIMMAKLNGLDPQGWLADVLARIADIP